MEVITAIPSLIADYGQALLQNYEGFEVTLVD